MVKENTEMLQPRYKVIADYPYCPYEIGDLVEFTDLGTSFHCTTTKEWNTFTEEFSDSVNYFSIDCLEMWPHLFQRLQWWENRNANEMPKYVKSLADEKGDIFVIQEWDMEMLVGWIDKKQRSVCSLTTFKPEYGYFPATEAEYNAQCQTKS